MNIRKIFIVCGVVALLIAAAVFIENRGERRETVRVGIILPLSGQYAALGESDRNAILMAKEDLHADNIELYFEDDKYDSKTAVTAYQKLRAINDIDALVVLSAPSIQSIQPLTNKDNIPLLGLGTTLVYERDSVFQLMPAGDTLFKKLGEIYGEKYDHMVVAHSNAALFSGNADKFIEGLPQSVARDDMELLSTTDYRTEVQKIIQKKPDAVTVFMPKEDALRFLMALRTQDPTGKIKIVCDFGAEIAVDEYAGAIGKDRLEGCISTNLGETATLNFRNAYKERFRSDPQITSDYAYDALAVIDSLVKAAPRGQWVNLLSGQGYTFNGLASGIIQFNSDGTRLDVPPSIHIYRDGKFEDF